MPQKYHSSFIPDNEFTTKLSPEEEIKFQKWAKNNKITDVDHPDSRYDYRGFFKETGGKPHSSGDVEHFPDTYKQPGHPTFSVESKYAKDRTDAGSWNGDTFVPAKKEEYKHHPSFIPDRHPATSEEFAPKSKPFFELLPTRRYDEYGIEESKKTTVKPLTRRISEQPESRGFLSDVMHGKYGSEGVHYPDKTIRGHDTAISDFGSAVDYYRNKAANTGNVRGAILTSLATEPMRLVGDVASDPVSALGVSGLFEGLNAFNGPRPPLSPEGPKYTYDTSTPRGQRLLGAGTVEGEAIHPSTDISLEEWPPVRRSTEVPYRAPESHSTAEGLTFNASKARDSQALSDALNYRNEFEPWRGARKIRELFGYDRPATPTEVTPTSGIDWGPQERPFEPQTPETSLEKPTYNPFKKAEEPVIPEKPTAKYKYTWEDENGKPMPMYEVIGGESHGSDKSAQGLRDLGIEIPESPKPTGKLGPHADMSHEELIQAVVDGKKPTAILENIPDQQLGQLQEKARAAGLHVQPSSLVDGDLIVAKNKPLGNKLDASLKRGDHETTGRLLGYSAEDVAAFGESIKPKDEFIPEEDQSMGGIYTGEPKPGMDEFVKSLNKDVETQDLQRMFDVPEKPLAKPEEPQFSRNLQFDPLRKKINDIINVKDKMEAQYNFRSLGDRLHFAKTLGETSPEKIKELETLRDKAREHYYNLIEGKKTVNPVKEYGQPPEVLDESHETELTKIQKEIDPGKLREIFREYNADLQYAKKDGNSDEIERIGQLRDEALDRWQTITGHKIKPEEPLFARSKQGGIKRGVNIKRAETEVTTGYSAPLESIMVREGLQNAIDAVRHLGENGEVKITIGKDNSITISDNGKGMTRKELETVFSDIHETGKESETGASGGKGIGKASYQTGGKDFSMDTVTTENGKKVRYSMNQVTPEQFSVHIPLEKEVVSSDTPTGTTIKTTLKKGQELYNAIDMLDKIVAHSRELGPKITTNRYGGDEKSNFNSLKDDKIISKSNFEGNDVTIAQPKDVKLEDRSHIYVNYLNNGMYQFRDVHYLDKTTPLMPKELIIDIHPTAEEGTSEYPFPTSRESIKGDLKEKIAKEIDFRLVHPQQQARQNVLRELYASMPEFTGVDTVRKSVLFDPGKRLTPEELEDLQTSPVINQMITHIDGVIDNIISRVGNDAWAKKLEGIGIVLDPHMHGVHIPNPDTAKSTILINPFEYIDMLEPEDAAFHITGTSLHEVAHIGSEEPETMSISDEELDDPRIGKYFQSYLQQVKVHGGLDMGHGISFVKRLGEVYAKFGPRRTFENVDKLQKIITDESGQYSPEVQRLLSIYQESRGREETTPDLLSGTGVKQATRRGGKGGIPPVGKPDGKGTPVQSALKKLANSIVGSKGLREEQELLYKKERAKRFAAFESVKTSGEAGANKSLGKLKGELPKLNIEELQLTQEERDSLFDAIKQSNISTGEKASGFEALHKLLSGGHVPQRSELHILDTVFGKGMGMSGGPGAASEFETLSNVLQASVGEKKATLEKPSKFRQWYELPRGLMSIDIPYMTSAAFRQGVGLAGTQRWFQAVGEQTKAFGDEAVYNEIMKDLENHPINRRRTMWNADKQRTEHTSIADQIGLKITDLKSLSSREEQIRSSLAERIPKVLQLGRYVRASNRSYTTFLNSLRTHTAYDWIMAANVLDQHGNIIDIAGARRIGNTINELTGAANLNIDLPFSRFTGSEKAIMLDKSADTMSLIFFSPKLKMRDIRMMNPLNYIKNDKVIRTEYLKGALRRAAVWAGFTGLAALALGATVSNDVASSDFGKAKKGNTRADAGSGILQWMVLASRQALGKSTSSVSGRTVELGSSIVAPTRTDLFVQFLINSLHPTLGLGAQALSASKNRPFYPASSVIERVTPMYTSDIHDIMMSDHDIRQIILGFSAGAFSMGSTTYGKADYGKPQYKIPYDSKFEGGQFFGPPIKTQRPGGFGRLRP